MVNRAVVLDVGGVFLVPDSEPVGAALHDAQLDFDETRVVEAHYRAVHGLDASLDPGWDPEAYLRSYVAALGLGGAQMTKAIAALLPVWESSTVIDLWRHRIEDSIDALRMLADKRVSLAIVSNSDGTVEAQLSRHEICQVGPGPGVEVSCIVDSAVVGASKPDPAAFAPALSALGLDPGEVAYVGDTERYDVQGALRAGMQPIHLDPLAICRRPGEHRHIRSLMELVD